MTISRDNLNATAQVASHYYGYDSRFRRRNYSANMCSMNLNSFAKGVGYLDEMPFIGN